MLSGVALALSEMPLEFVERHGLNRRVHDRGGEPEVQFLFAERERCLPVWLDGQLCLLRWGNRRGESRRLPCTAWTALATVEAGGWSTCDAVPVTIPATLGLDQGIWYKIRQGILGLAVHDESGTPRVYVLCEPASHYYQVMTRSRWMPVLIDERI